METKNEVAAFMEAVKNDFQDKPEIFEELKEVMKDLESQSFKTSSITVGVTRRVNELLKDHQELILAFNKFMPDDFKITLEPEDEVPQGKKPKLVDMDTRRVQEKPITRGEGLSFIISVQEALHDEPAKLKEFFKLVKGLHEKDSSTQVDAIKRIKELLEDHQELILAFKYFLPEHLKTILEPEDEEPTQKKPKLVDMDTRRVQDEEPTQQKVPSFEDALSFAKKLRVRFQDEDEVCKSFLNIIKLCENGSKSFTEVSKEVANLFGEHFDLHQEFLNFKPHLSATS